MNPRWKTTKLFLEVHCPQYALDYVHVSQSTQKMHYIYTMLDQRRRRYADVVQVLNVIQMFCFLLDDVE